MVSAPNSVISEIEKHQTPFTESDRAINGDDVDYTQYQEQYRNQQQQQKGQQQHQKQQEELYEAEQNPENQYADSEIIELKHHTPEEIASSGKWYDQRYFGFFPNYSNALVQIAVLSFVLFLSPGCFNAITGIGGSGISNPTVADHANVALYCTFATIGMVGGVVCNVIGPRLCLMIGGTGYFIYTASLLCYQHTENAGFCIFAGAYLGFCASLTWAAQGSLVMSYTAENRKGLAIMIFWVIFNLGAVIGSIIPLAQSINSGKSSANDGTFAAFLALIGVGVILASLLLPMDKVYKTDGSKVIAKRYPRVQDELKGMYYVMTHELKIYFMFPMFAASNWFYTYHFNNVNGGGKFNLRTRSLNSLLYWLAQMIGAILIGMLLDWQRFRRSVRARIGWVVVFVTGCAIYGGGLKFQLGFERGDDITPMDYTDGGYIGPMFLYIFYGMYDAIFQSFIFWVLGSLSNNPKKVALYASFYKSLQSAFAAIVWALDSKKVSFMSLFGSSWGLVCGSLIIASPLIFFKITDTTDIKKDGITEIIDKEEITSIHSVQQGPITEKDA